MQLTLKEWIIPIAVLLIVSAAVRQFGILSFHTLPTSSMEPGYPMGTLIVTSNVVRPDRNDVVTYRAIASAIPGLRPEEEGIFIGRLVGMGGDKLEIKDGYVYRNDQLADAGLLLKFMYQISEEAQELNREHIQALKAEDKFAAQGSMYLFLDDQEKLAYTGHQSFEKVNVPLNKNLDFPTKPWMEEDWTMINYGPVEVPPDHFFIVGDSRHNSEDSRVRGFVPKEDMRGVVLD